MAYDVAADPTLPNPVKDAILALSAAHEILCQITEGGNDYVFKHNRLLETYTIIKFYGWEGDARYHLEPKALTAIKSQTTGLSRDVSCYETSP